MQPRRLTTEASFSGFSTYTCRKHSYAFYRYGHSLPFVREAFDSSRWPRTCFSTLSHFMQRGFGEENHTLAKAHSPASQTMRDGRQYATSYLTGASGTTCFHYSTLSVFLQNSSPPCLTDSPSNVSENGVHLTTSF